MERTCAGGIEFLEQSFEIGRAAGVRSFLSSNEKCLDYVCDYTIVCMSHPRALIMTRSFIPDALRRRARERGALLFFFRRTVRKTFGLPMASAVALPSTPSLSSATLSTPNPTRNAASIDFLDRLQQAEQRDTEKASQRRDRVQLGKELRADKNEKLHIAQSEHKKRYAQTMTAAAQRKEAALNADFEARKKRNAEKQKRAERIREERLKQGKDRQAAWRRAHSSPAPSHALTRTPLRGAPSAPSPSLRGSSRASSPRR